MIPTPFIEKKGLDIPSTAFLLNYLKITGSRNNYWNLCGLNPTRQENLYEYEENYMNLFSNEFCKKIADKAQIVPTICSALRHKYIDDVVENAINQRSYFSNVRIQQIINLGSGLDSRSLIFKNENVTYFEIESKEILDIKREIYKNLNIDSNSKFIPMNYITGDIIESLKLNDVDFNKATLFIWEGNSMYIERNEVNFFWKKLKKISAIIL